MSHSRRTTSADSGAPAKSTWATAALLSAKARRGPDIAGADAITFRRGRPATEKQSQHVTPPEHRNTGADTPEGQAWRLWADIANDPARRRRHLVTTLRCERCGEVLGSLLSIHGATIIGAKEPDGPYQRFRLIGTTSIAPSAVSALRAASTIFTTMRCLRGHSRPLESLLLRPHDDPAATRSRFI